MSEHYHKLVRDKIPEILDGKGVVYEKTIANEEEYAKALITKLREELEEFEVEESVEELADILEVIDALKKLPVYENVLEIQKQKREARGGFDDRVILKGEKD